MKIYSESEGKTPFNWFEALNSENIDWNLLCDLSSSWVTCACGNQCAIIPRHYFDGEPVDKILNNLGYDFNEVISERQPIKALNILAKIEIRSAELIKEISCESK